MTISKQRRTDELPDEPQAEVVLWCVAGVTLLLIFAVVWRAFG